MTNLELKQIKKEYQSKVFLIVNKNHPHYGKKIRVMDYNIIPGCNQPGFLCKNISQRKGIKFFRVFEKTDLEPL